MIYILEAHAQDSWPIKVKHERPRPTSLQQRMAYAQECAQELALPSSFRVFVDDMDNSFNTAFAAWPTCYYLVNMQMRLEYVGECPMESDEESYDIRELFSFLRTL